MDREHVELLLVKAAQDEFALSDWEKNKNAPPELYGFHAQQAAEKLLKAAIIAAGVTYPLTHRLEDLIELIKDLGIPLPKEFDDLDNLTPFAVEFRYDIFPVEPEASLDKAMIRKWIQDLRAWVEWFYKDKLGENQDL